MKDLTVKFAIPNIIVGINDKMMIVPSMTLSTLVVCALVTFVPALMPLWMASATGSRV